MSWLRRAPVESNLATGLRLAICQGMLDWKDCPAVERSPDKVSGAWVFRGTRVPVKALFENLEAGDLNGVWLCGRVAQIALRIEHREAVGV